MDVRKMIALGLLGGGDALVSRINAWQNAQTTLVHVGAQSTLSTSGSFAATANPRTIISINKVTSGTGANWVIRQPGYIWGARAGIQQAGDATQWIKFKIFRLNAGNYDCIATSEQFAIPGTGAQTFTFSTPLPCAVGDLFGVSLSGNAVSGNRVGVRYSSDTNYKCGYLESDFSGSDPFSTILDNVQLGIEMLAHPPYVAITGDSIPEGHNVGAGVLWHSFYHNGPAGTITSEIGNQLRGIISAGTLLQYQNHSLGSTTYAWVLSTGIVSAIATKAKNILVHTGVNDVATSRTWAAVEADLNSILALVNAASPVPSLLIDEILPWTAGSDANAAVIRTWNGNLATWCAANGATLIRCHDEMGQIRPATGQIDDLLTAYNYDNVHLSQAGVNAMAAIWRRYL